jgi:hypothetical protein
MPTFLDLTKHVIDSFVPAPDSEIMAAFRPYLEPSEPERLSGAKVPLDQIFNLLHIQYGREEVNALVTERLSVPLDGNARGREHSLIKRVSSSASGVPQVVTTNFDRLFEIGSAGGSPVFHVPPAFPDIKFGSKIEGITYLHGRLVDVASESHSYVLSSADFGRAYLAEGWATNFIRQLLERYTVVMVGYQAEDPPVKYLLQGLNHDGKFDRSKLYAFDCGLHEEIEAKWRDRGVTAIAYAAHQDLWRSMEAWAERAEHPRKWRASVIAKCQQDPKGLSPHERGQVAHVLRTVQGARLFAELDPPAHPEWVCVMDANVRSDKMSRGFGDNPEVFDPCDAYGLDDDLKDISEEHPRAVPSNDNLLTWRDGDDNPHDFHRLGGRRVEGSEAVPVRLSHLITWIGKSIESPVLAWWTIRQNGLHPVLLQQLEWQIDRAENLSARARNIWNLIIESHRYSHYLRDGRWFDLKRRIEVEGWTAGALREFGRIAAPRLRITPPLGLARSKPPAIGWEKIRLHDLGTWDVVFANTHNVELEISDDLLPQVFNVLEEQLIVAAGLFEDIGTSYFRMQTCYPGRQVDGKAFITHAKEIVTLFLQLFDRLAAKRPELAKAHATTWQARDRFFFRKLKLYAFNKVDVFQAQCVAEELLSLDQETFWDTAVARELLFLLADRWNEFSEEHRYRLVARLLAGPDQMPDCPDEKFPALRTQYAARYARYLEVAGCKFAPDHQETLSKLITSIHGWSDTMAASMVVLHGSHSGWIATDEAPDAILALPVGEVVPRAKEQLNRDFRSFIEKRPFTGLVKTNPRKALAALTIAGKAGEYPVEFWSSMISDLPQDIPARLRRVFLNRLARLPYPVIAELGHALSGWLSQSLQNVLLFDEHLGWEVYDHIVDGLVSIGADATKSGLGEVHQGGKLVQFSTRTYGHALNGPIGMCAEALFSLVREEQLKAGSQIPDHIKRRVERLFTAPGEGSDHAVSIMCSQLNWLMFVDPSWTSDRVVPMLAFDHPRAEAAWSGFLSDGRVPCPALAEIVKPLLLALFPWVEHFAWDREAFLAGARWLGMLRMFQADEPGGLSPHEMRAALRTMSDDTRNRFIHWLGLVGQAQDDGWTKHVIPFINEAWPRERRFVTTASVRAWIHLLEYTNGSFAKVYGAVKKFLAPVEANDQPFYRFTRELGPEIPITVQFPDETLDFMDKVTPQILTRPSYQLPKVLALIVDAKPDLVSDPRYLRLIDLVERS